MDDHEHPRTVFRASRRKGKAVVPFEKEEEDEEQEEEECAGVGTSQGAEDDNVVNLSNNKEYVPISVDKPLLIGAQLTSPIADVKALVRRRNVIAPRTFFVKEPVIEAAEPPSFAPVVKMRMAKRAWQGCVGYVAGASSSTPGDDLQSSRIHNLEERFDKMN